MNLKIFEDTKGFILDTPKDMKLDFFGVDFWHLLCLSSIETSFAPLRIDRHSPSFIFDLPLSEGNFIIFFFNFFFFCFLTAFLKVFLDDPQSMAFILLALSQSFDFCSKPFFYPLVQSVSSKYLSFSPQCRV
jgi:hypothetical protein